MILPRLLALKSGETRTPRQRMEPLGQDSRAKILRETMLATHSTRRLTSLAALTFLGSRRSSSVDVSVQCISIGGSTVESLAALPPYTSSLTKLNSLALITLARYASGPSQASIQYTALVFVCCSE